MSELNENTELEEQEPDINEQVEEEVDDSIYTTVPIDESLTRHGEAADAKAVGDALALKADASAIVDITVDGQSKDASGNITVKAEHIPYSATQTVKQRIDEVDAKNAYNIPMSGGVNPQMIGDVLEGLQDGVEELTDEEVHDIVAEAFEDEE